MHAQPDILWIITTQWRAQALGFAGDVNAHTPFLDALASRSVNYAAAITPHPFGPFARAALLTGVESPANGVHDYYDPLPRGSHTIAHELAEAGYDTAYFGKWHLSPRDRTAPLVGEVHARQPVAPEDRGGFAFWEGFEGGFLLNDPWLQGNLLPTPTRFPGYQADVLCERLTHWLDGRPTSGDGPKPAPWFGVLSLESPHPPYAAPAAGCIPPDPAGLVLRPNVPSGEAATQARRELSGYYSHIEATDRALGRLLAHPRLSDTLVVFSSVHGDMHGSHGLFRKGWPHEESIRVPLLVHLPPSLRRFQLADPEADLVSLLDLHSWTRCWAGIHQHTTPPPPRLFQHCSMPSVVSLPHQCDRTWQAWRTRDEKLVLNEDGSPWLFFDLLKDPAELRNLVTDPGQAGRIATFLGRVRSTALPRAD